MMRNAAFNLVLHDTEFYIQISGHNCLASQNPDLAPFNSRGNLPEYKESISGLLIAFSLIALLFLSLASLPCKEFWFSCRKTSGYLGKSVHLGGFFHAMSSTAAGAAADTELLQPLITGLEKLNLTLQWRDNLCHFNNLILHCLHCKDWDKSFHGAEQLCSLSEIRNTPSFPCWVSPTLQLYLLIH